MCRLFTVFKGLMDEDFQLNDDDTAKPDEKNLREASSRINAWLSELSLAKQ